MFKDITREDVFYRLWRLKLLIAAAAFLPVVFFGMAIFAGVWVGWWLWYIWVALVILMAVKFPNAWTDIMTMAATLSLVLFLSSFGGALGIGPILGTPLALLVGFGLYLALTNLVFKLDHFPFPREVISLKKRLKVSPDVVRRALFLRPGARCGYHICGPADQGGVFNVETLDISTYSAHCDSFAAVDEHSGAGIDQQIGYLAKIISRDATSQETVLVVDFSTDENDVVTLAQSIEDDGRGGTFYQSAETGMSMGLFTGLGYVLTEAGHDSLRAALDAEQGRPTPALLMASRDAPLYALARWFAAHNPALRAEG